MSIHEVLLGRRTVHRFEITPVDDSIVKRALECAAHAPNHRVTDPWRFHLIGEETAAAITERNARMLLETKGAAAAKKKTERWSQIPGWIVVTCRRSQDPLRAQEDYAACACAIQNLMLSLWADGVASKWSTGPVTRDDEMLGLIGADPLSESVVGMVWYGYAAEMPKTQRKPASDSVIRHP